VNWFKDNAAMKELEALKAQIIAIEERREAVKTIYVTTKTPKEEGDFQKIEELGFKLSESDEFKYMIAKFRNDAISSMEKGDKTYEYSCGALQVLSSITQYIEELRYAYEQRK
jgi:predicted HAD superfamily phosphohydrolase